MLIQTNDTILTRNTKFQSKKSTHDVNITIKERHTRLSSMGLTLERKITKVIGKHIYISVNKCIT